MTSSTEPHVSPREIGSVPAIILKIPPGLRVGDLAAAVARMGFKLRWIYRGKRAASAENSIH
jgi:hypothetical protein